MAVKSDAFTSAISVGELIKNLEDIKLVYGDIPVAFWVDRSGAWIPYRSFPVVEEVIENHGTGFYCENTRRTQAEAAVNTLGQVTKIVVI